MYFIEFHQDVKDDLDTYATGQIIKVDEDGMYKWVQQARDQEIKIVINKGECVLNFR